MGNGPILLNKVKCLICKDIVVSTDENPIVTCMCGNITVEGGSYYKLIKAKEENSYEDLSKINYNFFQ